MTKIKELQPTDQVTEDFSSPPIYPIPLNIKPISDIHTSSEPIKSANPFWGTILSLWTLSLGMVLCRPQSVEATETKPTTYTEPSHYATPPVIFPSETQSLENPSLTTQAPVSQAVILLDALRTITSPIAALPFSNLAESAYVATINLEIQMAKHELDEKQQMTVFKEVINVWVQAVEKMEPVTPQHLCPVLETCLGSLNCLKASVSN